MNISSLTSKGQITIPAALREQFLLQPGDKVSFEVIDGQLVLRPLKKTLDSLAGCFSEDIGGKVASLDDMEQAIHTGIVQSLKKKDDSNGGD